MASALLATGRSAVVELGADGGEALAADAIGLAAHARDQLPSLQPVEDAEAAIVEAPAACPERLACRQSKGD
jgi:hypothetical protein